MRWTATGAAALAVLVGVLVTGCGSGPSEQLNKTSNTDRQSFDVFLGDKVGVIDYAVNLVRNRCLADAGYPQNLQGMAGAPSVSFSYLKISAKSFGATSEDEARRLGFGLDAPAQPGRVVSFDPSYDKNLERCQGKAYDSLDSDTKRILNAYKDLGNLLFTEFGTAMERFIKDQIPDAAASLQRCLAEKGYRSTNEAAFLAEPDHRTFGVQFGDVEEGDEWEPQRIKGTVQLGPPVPMKRYIPTAEESKLAVAWFQCRRDIGLTSRLIQFAREAQAEIVVRHESQLLELGAEIERVARAAARLTGP
ncbi:hypothetical protein AB0J90_28630 [Micromonospora sp. NPDC049523]|uniref:hypothetical protein n=1 Tax=Micromonospora sp. NPDC049523 TaxID=3155921 RepID=UPI003434ACA5